MSATKLTVTRHGNDVRITLPNGVDFMFHSGDPWAIGSEKIAHKAMLCLFDRITALEAEKAERERQEPVAWVLFDDIFIAPKDMQDDPPNLECMKPLYAHPLALREPTEDECREIWRAIVDLVLLSRGAPCGRAMWQAVREVMK